MNFIERYFLNKALQRVYRDTAIYGSCHSQLTHRHRWNPIRLILGPIKYKFFHPLDVICQCDWKECLKITPNLCKLHG